ncbi:MAG: nucleoside hydrolase [Planctomycetaceae bacterium]|nr:nucleoside hydrolase [Planctomycetaceae bacterium]
MSPEKSVEHSYSPLTKAQQIEVSAAMKKHKVIIDADPGVIDALAIIVALLDPQVEVLALTATAGIVPGTYANRNLQAILNRVDPPKFPRVGCCEEHLPASIPSLREVPTPLLMGETGLGDFMIDAVTLASPHSSAKVMVELVKNAPGEITILTLGPLTNLVLASEISPDFLRETRQIVCLGGSIHEGGDATAAAEGNIYADPDSARFVFKSNCHKILVPLDVSDQLWLSFSDLSRLPQDQSSELSAFIIQLISFALRSARRHLGQEGVALRGLAALTAVTRPQLFARRLMAVDVETSGELTRGMTVVDQRGLRHEDANLEVVTEIETRPAFDYFTGVLWNALENEKS